MKLLSLVNSGESLEKVLSLIVCAYESNSEFYYSFDEVIVFYYPNIIKSKPESKHVGLLKSLYDNKIIQYFIDKKISSYYLFKNKTLNCLVNSKKISERQKHKLTINDGLFRKFITNISWIEIFPEFEKTIIEFLEQNYSNLKILKINDIYSITHIVKTIPHYQSFAKIYFFDYNGSTILKKINKSYCNNDKLKILQQYNNASIYYSYNVYLFLMIISDYIDNNYNIILGYRFMKSSPRMTYDVAIDYMLKKHQTIIEPRNVKFNEELNKISYRVSVNERSYIVIYKLFIDFLKKILINKLNIYTFSHILSNFGDNILDYVKKIRYN